MKKSPLLIIGVFGLVITGAMHVGLSLAGVGGNLGVWLACYSMWLCFSIIGLVMSRKR
ncbi:hypothetical protein [Stenotrophomonas maltophilia]|uniref:hypothetical protein n=1 Tax=Stenotrophomonas maltophilia TaxID=40324 RepID=UPI000A581F2F|nr:hypothetical protein [Stenotrophomonas maltophilia]